MVNRIEYTQNDEHFIIYPEYTDMNISDYGKIAEETGTTVIGGTKETYHIYAHEKEKWIQALMVRRDGHPTMTAFRSKSHLTSGEMKEGFEEVHPKDNYPVWNTNKNNVLVIICYEICFPEDYYHLAGQADMIVHLVGYPMFDRHQYKAWYGMQKAMVKHFNAPLISCCGGEMNEFNMTHVITPEMLDEIDQMGNFTEERDK